MVTEPDVGEVDVCWRNSSSESVSLRGRAIFGDQQPAISGEPKPCSFDRFWGILSNSSSGAAYTGGIERESPGNAFCILPQEMDGKQQEV